MLNEITRETFPRPFLKWAGSFSFDENQQLIRHLQKLIIRYLKPL